MKKILLLTIVLNLFTLNAYSFADPVLKAPYAILVDFETDSVLYEKNADIPISPSSMSKLMTIYLVFDKLKKGLYSLDTLFVVGDEAWKKSKNMNANSGSTMFLEYGEHVSIENLIRGIIVNSGNDAAVVLAENISGSEEKFVNELNELAKKLGLSQTILVNASGWYDKNHLMSVRDLSILSSRIIKDFPEYYHYFGEKEFLYKKDLTGNKDNRNKLLWIMPAADGLKTGHTSKGGYGLASSAIINGRRLISIVNGVKGVNPSYLRVIDSKNLLEWGFKEFSNVSYYKANEEIFEIPVWFGKKNMLKVGTNRDIVITLKNNVNSNIEIIADYLSPIVTPIEKDTEVGVISVYIDGKQFKDYKLYALETIHKKGFIGRIFENIKQIVLNIIH